VFTEECGLDKDHALKLASGFGTGMQQGEVCGAIAGAIIVLSLKYGYHEGTDIISKEKIRTLIQQLNKTFCEKHGTLICKELVGMDLSIKENLDHARQTGIFKSLCATFVNDTIDILEELLSKEKQQCEPNKK